MKQFQLLKSSGNYSVSAPSTMLDLIREQTERFGSKTAYIYLEDGKEENVRISFEELDKKSKIAAAFLQKKYAPGQRCVLLFPSGIEFIIALFACIQAGLIAVPAYPPRRNRKSERFWSILSDSDAAAIIAAEPIAFDIRKNFSEDERLSRIDLYDFGAFENESGQAWESPEVSAEDICILQYTSGSTGNPRGVEVSHGNIMNNFEVVSESFHHDEDLVVATWLPNFHDMGLFGTTLQSYYKGGTTVILPPQAFIRDPASWLLAITKYKAVTAGCPNFALDYCCDKITAEDKKQIDLSSLRVFFCGSEPIHKETFDRFEKEFGPCGFKREMFYPTYGLAESTLMVTGASYDDLPLYNSVSIAGLETAGKIENASNHKDEKFLVGCGYPWMGNQVAIVDPGKNELLEDGRIGEVWIAGPSVCKGYWKQEMATRETFQAELRSEEGGHFMRSGDLGFVQDGHLFVTGRLKDLIIIRGQNYYPQDIERVLESSHEALRAYASAAFSVNIEYEEHLVVVAEVERAYLRDVPAEEIFYRVKEDIAREFEIQVFAIMLIRTGSIPKTTSGKIQRKACKLAFLRNELNLVAEYKMDLKASFESSEIDRDNFSQADMEKWLVYWLSKKVKIDPSEIDPSKSMFSYGLDSIAAVELEKEVMHQFGIEWSLSDFLEDNRIDHLARQGYQLLQKQDEEGDKSE